MYLLLLISCRGEGILKDINEQPNEELYRARNGGMDLELVFSGHATLPAPYVFTNLEAV